MSTQLHRPDAPIVALLGVGEAGCEIGRDLVTAGVDVRGYDPRVESFPAGIERRSSESEAVRDADLILSANSAPDSTIALDNAIGGLAAGAVFADLNTTSPALKASLARRLVGTGVFFCDVALMSPVPGKGVATPMLVAGDGAARLRDLLTPLGGRVTIQPGEPGTAISRKLLRSVFYKSVSAAIVEALAAAEAAGCAEWLRENITEELTSFGPDTMERMIYGVHKHAHRRAQEMTAAVEQLADLGIESRMAAGACDFLRELDATSSS